MASLPSVRLRQGVRSTVSTDRAAASQCRELNFTVGREEYGASGSQMSVDHAPVLSGLLWRLSGGGSDNGFIEWPKWAGENAAKRMNTTTYCQQKKLEPSSIINRHSMNGKGSTKQYRQSRWERCARGIGRRLKGCVGRADASGATRGQPAERRTTKEAPESGPRATLRILHDRLESKI